MANNEQKQQRERSPRAPATRGELYLGFLIIWVYLSFTLGELLRVEFSWTRSLYWAVSLMMVVVYLATFLGMWWVGRRETDAD